MDRLESYRKAIVAILEDYASIPYSHGEIVSEVICDRERDRYLLMEAGWDQGYRVHGALIHIDIQGGKLWIQHDGTERGIAGELVAAGVPKTDIVLAFRPPNVRKFTEFAAA